MTPGTPVAMADPRYDDAKARRHARHQGPSTRPACTTTRSAPETPHDSERHRGHTAPKLAESRGCEQRRAALIARAQSVALERDLGCTRWRPSGADWQARFRSPDDHAGHAASRGRNGGEPVGLGLLLGWRHTVERTNPYRLSGHRDSPPDVQAPGGVTRAGALSSGVEHAPLGRSGPAGGRMRHLRPLRARAAPELRSTGRSEPASVGMSAARRCI